MAQFSFDLVNQLNVSEINNVFDQVKREIGFRYDFKNTPASVEWLDADKSGLVITGANQMQLDAIVDIIRKKLSGRNLSQKLLDLTKEPTTNNMQTRQEVPFKTGLDQESLKKLSKAIRDNLPKLKSQIQGEALRVTGASKDDLQQAMTLIRSQELDYPLQFTNFK
jgi:uncharacterized protein YajQ (UPF0234 family)